MATKSKSVTKKQETVTARIIVAVDHDGKVYAATGYNEGFHAAGDTSDEKLVEGAVDSSNEVRPETLTLRILEVSLPLPVPLSPVVKRITIDDDDYL